MSRTGSNMASVTGALIEDYRTHLIEIDALRARLTMMHGPERAAVMIKTVQSSILRSQERVAGRIG